MTRKRETKPGPSDPRSRAPAVGVLIEEPAIRDLILVWSRPLVIDAVHETLDTVRRELADAPRASATARPGSATTRPRTAAPTRGEIVARVEAALLESEKDRLRPVVNATGIILHTGLGRAVLPQRAVDALAGMNRCCNLQIDVETGLRGKRNYMTERLLCRLTGAEAAMVVTNNAAATFLILAALCRGREVVVSRGQLIEIGGSFRLPDCIRQSGAVMVEVGTTNKTHLRDYEAALGENTGMILRVNPSNYRVVGFSKSVGIEELATLKARQPFVLVDDLGCGALVNLENYGLPKEPTVQDSIAAGADLACFSGDKLIGGPQAGIIVGRKDLIAHLKKHPLSRMLRVGKLTDLALEQTLRLFLEPENLVREHPTIRMLAAPTDEMKKKAARMARALKKRAPALRVEVRPGQSATGGGSLPATPIPTWVLAVASPDRSAEELCRLLRRNEPPVIARVADDRVVLDVRTLLDGEERSVVEALVGIASTEK